MKLSEVQQILDAQVLTGRSFLQKEVQSAFGSDLMSDVLAYVNEGTILLTGLNNPQVIRTAEMIDLFAVVFVRGKVPQEAIISMAKENNFTIMTTEDTLYTASGKLYEKGLKGVCIKGEDEEWKNKRV